MKEKVQFQPICAEMRIVHLLRHNHNCSLARSKTVTKLGLHIDVIIVRPVIPHIAGIVVGYWRNGCSYRKITREVGIHSNSIVSMASSKDSVNVDILFVEGVLDDHVKLMTGMTACCIALPGKSDDSVYRG